MDVDPTELIPSMPPAAKAAPFPKLPASPLPADDLLDDADLEDENATLMFKRPGPPRKPPPAKKPAAPPAKPPAKPGPPPMKVMDRPLAPKAPKGAPAPPAFSAPTHLSERPMFEVTLGSEQPLLATPEASEISLLGVPRAPNLGLLAPPQASDLGSLDFKMPTGAGVSPALPALPLLDFSRDVSSLSRSSPPGGIAPRVVEFARTHAKMLVMVGGTALIATVSWGVFHAAASSSTPIAASSAQATPRPPAPVVRTGATVAPVVAPPTPAAVAATEPTAPAEQPSETTEVATPRAEAPAPEVAERPAAVAVAAPAPAEPNERNEPATAAVETNVKPAGETAKPRTTGTTTAATERPATTRAAADPVTELPKAAPEPAPAPRPAAPTTTVGEGMDGTPDFDQSAAMQALRQAAESSQRCRTADTPSGGVRVAVTFARSGAVSATQVEGSAAGTPLADCIAGKFQSAHVPPFRGSVMTVRKTVMFN